MQFGHDPAKIEAESAAAGTGEEKGERVETTEKAAGDEAYAIDQSHRADNGSNCSNDTWGVDRISDRGRTIFVFYSKHGWSPQDRRSCHFCFQSFSWLDFFRLGARACLGLYQRS